MILSHRHKFIFIKGEKVGGTSAEIALAQICGPDDIVTPISARDEQLRPGAGPRNYRGPFYWLTRKPRFYNHMPLKDVQIRVPEADDYEVLCVERSPYSKVMSLANWALHHQAYSAGGELPSTLDLASAVDRLIKDGQLMRVFNLNRYRDLQGKLSVKPWRTENLAEDMAAFFRSRGLEPIAPPVTKRGASSDTLDPLKVLTREQLGMINQKFAAEFWAFDWPML